MRKTHIGHAEIGNRCPDRGVVHRDADHQPEREDRIHQRLAPFRLSLAEMPIDMQRLRVQRQAGEKHVVHLGDGAAERMAKELRELEILKVESGHFRAAPCALQDYPARRGSESRPARH
jgi:hypothetical protein